MAASLETRAWFSLVLLGLVMALLLCVSAGTTRYLEAWLYLAIFVGGSALVTLWLMRHDRALLERRMRGGPTAEKRPAQKIIMLCTSTCFVAMLIVPGLDRRFGGSAMPLYVVLAGDALVAIGLYLIFLVYRVNTFTSATIEVSPQQHVISTGPYAIVRHPMYASASFYVLGTPLALGSWWAFVPAAAMLPCLMWRIIDEERMLAQSLPGYDAYRERVRWRVVPGVW
jgi:protein-S-isoprenylcysteine O-methyltransferase Ste14